jgi:hypothetical protein
MTSFTTEVAPLFREKDVTAMAFMFDLRDYDAVRDNADDILAAVADGSMPCDESWSQDQVAVFRSWVDEGFPA